MTTYEIINSETNEVVDTADDYVEAVGRASYLSSTTKILHLVPVRERVLDFAV